jgi:hypothetical protein
MDTRLPSFFVDINVKTEWNFQEFYYPFTRSIGTWDIDVIKKEVLQFMRFLRTQERNGDLRFQCTQHTVDNLRKCVYFLINDLAPEKNWIWISDQAFLWLDENRYILDYLWYNGVDMQGRWWDQRAMHSPSQSPLSLTPLSPLSLSVEVNTNFNGGDLLNGLHAQDAPLGIYTDNGIPDLVEIREELEEEDYIII